MIGIWLCLHNEPSICAFSNEMSVPESVHKYMCHTGHWTCLYIACIRLHWHYRTAHQSAVIIIVVLWVPKWKKSRFYLFLRLHWNNTIFHIYIQSYSNQLVWCFVWYFVINFETEVVWWRLGIFVESAYLLHSHAFSRFNLTQYSSIIKTPKKNT